MASLVNGTRDGGRSQERWDKIRTEWRNRELRTLREEVSALDVGVDVLDSLLFREEILKKLTEVFAAVPPHVPDGKPLLAFYVYGRCLKKWEESEDYDSIRTVLSALRVATEPYWPEDQLLSIIVSQAKLVDAAMSVEEAMNCSCPTDMVKWAGTIVDGLDALPTEELELGNLADLRRIMQLDAATNKCYFAAIKDVASAMRKLVGPGRASVDFPSVLEKLKKAEDAPAIEGDVYQSELRAHRVSLEALHDRADDPHIRIDAADLVYLYPFALERTDPEGTGNSEVKDAPKVDIETIEDGTMSSVAAPGTGMKLEVARDELVAKLGIVEDALAAAGFAPKNARELELNDLWESPGGREPIYSIVSIELPQITVTTTAGDELDFEAAVRLSGLGNHHVRVWADLDKASLHHVNQALRRGSPAMGAEKLTSGSKNWKKFPSYAGEIIDEIAAALGARRVDNGDATFHVVLTARSISVQPPLDGKTPLVTLDVLEKAVGASLLFHPVRHLVTSLEEWIRYPPPMVTNLLGGLGYARDFVVRTENTTVTYMPASPEWLVDEYREMIEFVASIPPLLTLWGTRVANHLAASDPTSVVDDLLAELENEDAKARNERMRKLDKQIPKLPKQKAEIRELESDIRGRLAFLRSPALCRTRGQRQFLDKLWEAAGLPALERELERHLTLLAERQEVIAAQAWQYDEIIRRAQQEHAERLERPVKSVLGLLGVASLAGLLEWMNVVFELDGRLLAWGEALVLLVLVIVVVVLFRRTLKSR